MIELPPVALQLSEADVNTTTGAIVVKGPLTIPALPAGSVVIGTSYDSTIPGWRILYAVPAAS